MQTISHKQPNIHPIFNDIERFYAITSEAPQKTLISHDFDRSFRELWNLFAVYGNAEYDLNFVKKQYSKIHVLSNEDEKRIILCFSGGKDSTATALYYKDLGYDVRLYHLRGINQTYKDEWKSAIELADALKLPIIMEEVSLHGAHIYTEHPVKNMIIANMALQWGIREGFTTRLAFGNYYTSRIGDDPFTICSGDDVEMWEAYENIIRRILPKFKMELVMENVHSSFEAIYKHRDEELLPRIKSCIGAFRYREYLHRNNEEKYGVKLLPHRCGSCWKCAMEYIWFTDNGVFEYNKEFYKHCLKILQKNIKTESGVLEKDLKTVWSHYFFYDIEKSEFFKEQE